jgi:hypothetical protein
MVGQPTAKDRLRLIDRLRRTGLSTGAAFCGPGRRWRLRQGLWLVAKEGLVPIRGQSPALASAQKIAGSL